MHLEEEKTFWIQIICDHLEFIADEAASSESLIIETAEELLEQSPSYEDTDEEIMEWVQKVRIFKSSIIEEQTQREVKISLSPTFIKHSRDELDTFVKILQEEDIPLLYHHNLWLNDTAGHCCAIKCRIDDADSLTKKKYNKMKKEFDCLYKKSMEYSHFLDGAHFPALDKLTDDSAAHVALFLSSVEELREMNEKKMILTTIPDAMLDHMLREQVYYLNKINALRQN